MQPFKNHIKNVDYIWKIQSTAPEATKLFALAIFTEVLRDQGPAAVWTGQVSTDNLWGESKLSDDHWFITPETSSQLASVDCAALWERWQVYMQPRSRGAGQLHLEQCPPGPGAQLGAVPMVLLQPGGWSRLAPQPFLGTVDPGGQKEWKCLVLSHPWDTPRALLGREVRVSLPRAWEPKQQTLDEIVDGTRLCSQG